MFNSPPFFLEETHLIWQSRYGISENKTRGIYERERERERERVLKMAFTFGQFI